MLVLSREVQEAITIGEDITIAVLEIHGKRVRLGIEAPAEVPVHRAEVARDMHRGGGELKSLANRKQQWLHVWEQGEYRGATKCTEVSLSSLLKPEDASYRGIFYRLTDSPNCPTA